MQVNNLIMDVLGPLGNLFHQPFVPFEEKFKRHPICHGDQH